MDIAYALRFAFEDKDWQRKYAMLAGLVFLAFIPLVGLIPLAVLLGWLLALARNVREGLPRPLPAWDDLVAYFSQGAPLLVAIIAYHMPLILLNLCNSWIIGGIASGFLGSFVNLLLLCIGLPLSFAYFSLAWALLVGATAEHLRTGKGSAFYRLGSAFDFLRAHDRLLLGWLGSAWLLNLGLAALMLIPCLGWIAGPTLALPAHGHLLGQVLRRANVSLKPTPEQPAPKPKTKQKQKPPQRR